MLALKAAKNANLMLLKLERGNRAAGEIVLNAAITHGRPVAHRARGQFARGARKRKQLLEGLHAVKDARRLEAATILAWWAR
jgi:hypothetical protein